MSQKVMASGCPYTQTPTAAQNLPERSVSASKKPVCTLEVEFEIVFDEKQMDLQRPKLLQRGMSETFDDLNTFLAGQSMGADPTFQPDWLAVKLKKLEMLVEGADNKSRVEAPLQDAGFARNAVSRRMEPKLESKIPPLSSSQEFELLTDGSVEALLLDAGFARKVVSRRTEPKPESKIYP